MVKTHLIEKKNPQHNQLWEWEETPETREALKTWERRKIAREVALADGLTPPGCGLED